MKKTLLFLAMAAAVMLLLPNCKKESKKAEVSTDYRDKYVGTWDFTVYTRQFNMLDSIVELDTIYYLGNISLENTDQIKIQYTQDDSVVLNIDDTGNLSGFPTQYCSGEFLNDSQINLSMRWGGLGGGTNHTVNGIRQ